MIWDWQLIVSISVPILGMIGYIMKSMITGRIDKLEKKQENVVTKEELRLSIDTTLYPIKEDINEIKNKLDKIFDFLFFKGK